MSAATSAPRRHRRSLYAAAGIVAALALAGAGAMAGVVPVPGQADGDRPACSTLPSVADSRAALERNQSFVRTIEGVGPGVEVAVTTPCPDPDQSIVTITVHTSEQRDRVDQLLREGNGFGVPAELVSG